MITKILNEHFETGSTFRIWPEPITTSLKVINLIKEVGMEMFFNDTLNTFYSRLYSIGYIVMNHSDSQRGNQLQPLFGLFFPISSKDSFTYIIPQTGQHLSRPL